MDFTSPTYVVSQVFVVLMYVSLCSTYFLKSRSKIIVINIIGHLFQMISFILLSGFTGVAMNIVYTIRDIYLYIANKKENDEDRRIKDVIFLTFLFVIIIASSIYTYNDIYSLFSVFATVFSTIAIWQKNTRIYKLLGIPSSVCWLSYHVYLQSILAIILESILLISILIGYIIDIKIHLSSKKGIKNKWRKLIFLKKYIIQLLIKNTIKW